MFHKPLVVKSTTGVKSSERKKLLAGLPPVDGITNKTVAAVVKLMCSKGETVYAYTFDKEPLLFETEEQILFPTVYLTWKVPEAFPVLVTSEAVFAKLERGADLFLQGVTRPLRETNDFPKHAPVAVSVLTSTKKLRGPLAIGFSLMSSMEMIANHMRGPGVHLLHFYGDLLWELGSRAHPSEVSVEVPSEIPKSYESEFPALGFMTLDEKAKVWSGSTTDDSDKMSDTLLALSRTEPNQETGELTVSTQEQVEMEVQSADSMESLLERCFLTALKYRLTKGQLPLDVGEFYSRYLLPCVPPDRHIDMKKTIYKKFTVFLEKINGNKNGPIVKIIAKHKGSEAIVEVNWKHAMLTNFKSTDEKLGDSKTEKKMVKVDEYLAVTEPVSAIFRGHCDKGSLLEKPQVKEIITTYVKSRNRSLDDKVLPSDEILISLLKSDEPVDWNTLFQKITSKMTKTYVVTWVDGRQLIRKVELPKVAFKVENRAGNKKVTLVNNLSVYGIDCKNFCHEIQTGAAASASVVSGAPQCEGPQVLVQGNQILFMRNLLFSKFGIDRKYMSGLEFIPKKR